MRRCGRLALGLGIAALGGVSATEPPTAPFVVSRLQAWLDATATLEGRFNQSLVSGALGGGVEESGRLYLERPRRMRWDYEEPERKIAWIDGEHTRLYLKEDAQLWEGALAGPDALILDLLAANTKLADRFEASLGSRPAGAGQDVFRLRLLPRDPPGSYRELSLLVRSPEFAPEEAEVLDAAGNRIVYRFSDLRRNRRLPAGLFEFVPPPGTEILRRPE